MKSVTSTTLLSLLALLVPSTLSQNVTVPATCTDGFLPGTDTVVVTIPYTYAQTLSIIGSFRNLTWSGNPADTVTLNGTDNTPGTARSYTAAGANVVETLLIYDSPPAGPYYEVHNLATINVPAFSNVSSYAQYDGTTVVAVCGGKASQFNFTINFCADNVTAAAELYHYVHGMDALGAGKLLGGANFTSCAALGGNATATSTGSAPVSTFTGGVGHTEMSWWTGLVAGGAMLALV